MPVDASIVFAPPFTTLVGAKTFTTLPLNVSEYARAQFQIWREPIRVKTAGGDSRDTETRVHGPRSRRTRSSSMRLPRVPVDATPPTLVPADPTEVPWYARMIDTGCTLPTADW